MNYGYDPIYETHRPYSITLLVTLPVNILLVSQRTADVALEAAGKKDREQSFRIAEMEGQLQATLTSRKDGFTVKDAETASVLQQNASLLSAKTALEARLIDLETLARREGERAQASEVALKQMQSAKQVFENRVRELSTKVDQLTSSESAELSDMRRQRDEGRARVAEAEEQLDDMKRAKRLGDIRIVEADDEARRCISLRDSDIKRIQDLEKEVIRTKEELTAASRRLFDLETSSRQESQELAALKLRNAALEADVQGKAFEHEKMTILLADLTSAKESGDKSLASTEDQLSVLKTKLLDAITDKQTIQTGDPP